MASKKLQQVQLSVSIFREGDTFVAYAPTLDISTSGDNLREVKANFEELVGIYFEELESMGTTKEVLESLGWQKDDEWHAPVEVDHELQNFSVPV